MSSTKLGTIVAVDVDGFSELAAADANAAVAAVAQLVERCRYEASAHGGRIFDTSGDSVLMEFTNVASAVHAAAELAAEPDPPIRIGVHLGEVSVGAVQDLLDLNHGEVMKTAVGHHGLRVFSVRREQY